MIIAEVTGCQPIDIDYYTTNMCFFPLAAFYSVYGKRDSWLVHSFKYKRMNQVLGVPSTNYWLNDNK